MKKEALVTSSIHWPKFCLLCRTCGKRGSEAEEDLAPKASRRMANASVTKINKIFSCVHFDPEYVLQMIKRKDCRGDLTDTLANKEPLRMAPGAQSIYQLNLGLTA